MSTVPLAVQWFFDDDPEVVKVWFDDEPTVTVSRAPDFKHEDFKHEDFKHEDFVIREFRSGTKTKEMFEALWDVFENDTDVVYVRESGKRIISYRE